MATDFGTDFSTFTASGTVDIDPRMPLIGGPELVLQVCARRLMTPSGFFRRYPDFGFDLRTKLGSRMSLVARIQLQNAIENELLKEERVKKCKAEMTEESPNNFKIRISITLAEGPFTLVLQASSLTVEILEISKG